MKQFILIILLGLILNLFIVGQTSDFQLLLETENNCAEFDYDLSNNLNWYGVFQTDTGDYLIEIELTILEYNSSMDITNKSIAGKYIFWTSKKEKSKFLIGTTRIFEEHKVSHHDDYFFNHTNVLYPGQQKTVYTINNLPERKSYELNAIGCVMEIGYCPNFQNYKLRLSDKNDEWKSQDLTNDISYKGECGLIDLRWFGDIDFDGLPDLLFSSSSTKRNQMNLFISSEASKDNFVKLVSIFELGNCH